MPKFKDLTGKKFGRLFVIKCAGTRFSGNKKRCFWECICDCGKTKDICGDKLVSGHTTSCGCRLKEINENVWKICYKHGLSNSRLSNIYYNMINRCYRKKHNAYKYYGERGIKVCDAWLGEKGLENFCEWLFVNGYKEDLTKCGRNKLSIDRIDVNGDYCPENCRISDIYTQSNNKRNNLKLKINGEIDTIGNWSRKLNIPYYNLYNYYNGTKNCKYPHLKIEAVKNDK